MMQATVESIYEKFTSLVAEGRDMKVEDVDAVAQGRVWTGAQALEIGLVDKIGTLEDAMLHAAMLVDAENGLSNINVVEYPKPQTTMDMLNSRLTGEEIIKVAKPGKIYARIPYAIEVK